MNIKGLPRPTAVCLDLDNTLYAYEPCNSSGMDAVYGKLENILSIDKRQLVECFTEARRQIKKLCGPTAASHSRLLYFQRLLELLGLKSQIQLALDLEQTFWRAYMLKMELFDGVLDFLYSLRSKDIPIAIVTDMTVQIQFRKLMYLNIDGLIDHVVTSEEAGADKPDPVIYKLAKKKLEGYDGAIWMVGDDIDKDIVHESIKEFVSILKIYNNKNMSFIFKKLNDVIE